MCNVARLAATVLDRRWLGAGERAPLEARPLCFSWLRCSPRCTLPLHCGSKFSLALKLKDEGTNSRRRGAFRSLGPTLRGLPARKWGGLCLPPMLTEDPRPPRVAGCRHQRLALQTLRWNSPVQGAMAQKHESEQTVVHAVLGSQARCGWPPAYSPSDWQASSAPQNPKSVEVKNLAVESNNVQGPGPLTSWHTRRAAL